MCAGVGVRDDDADGSHEAFSSTKSRRMARVLPHARRLKDPAASHHPRVETSRAEVVEHSVVSEERGDLRDICPIQEPDSRPRLEQRSRGLREPRVADVHAGAGPAQRR